MTTHPLHQFKFCPKCGSNTFHSHNFKANKCEDCGFVYYFNPSAATVALVFNEKNELLVVRRAHEPAKGTLDLPGGFLDMEETGEEGVVREVEEETGLEVTETQYLFSLPNTYEYSEFLVHTLDQFFKCSVKSLDQLIANDDAAESFFLPLDSLNPEDFGLNSIRNAVKHLLTEKNIYL